MNRTLGGHSTNIASSQHYNPLDKSGALNLSNYVHGLIDKEQSWDLTSYQN